MDNFKKIASLEELEGLKNLLNYENSGKHEPVDKREKILVDFTSPCGKISPTNETQNIYINTDSVFVNPNADENNPCNYDFGKVDEDIKAALDKGEAVICNFFAKDIPTDAKKWAKICENIIARYDSIKYVGIWNTPELNTQNASMFFELYRSCASILKNRFPDIKIGGASFTSAMNDYIHEFFNLLLNDKTVPFDFFSWNCKAYKVEQILNAAYAARTMLDKYGFTDTESVLSGWKYEKKDTTPDKNKAEAASIKGAAFVAGTLIGLSRLPLNIAKYCGAQSPKTDLAHKAFGEIFSLGIKVTSDTAADHVYVLGAKNDDKGAFMAVNFNPYEDARHNCVFDLKGIFGKKCEIYLLDKEHDLEQVYSGNIPETYELLENSVILVKLV